MFIKIGNGASAYMSLLLFMSMASGYANPPPPEDFVSYCSEKCYDMEQASISDRGSSEDANGFITLDHGDNYLSVSTGENDDRDSFFLSGLVVNADSVVMFNRAYWGEYPYLDVGSLQIYNDSTLIIGSEGVGHFSFGGVGDFLSVEDVKRHVAIDTGDGVLKQAVWRGNSLVGWSGVWTPVPEPTCCGALLGGLGLGVGTWRRRRVPGSVSTL